MANVNDILGQGWRLAVAGNDVATGPCRVVAVHLGGGADASSVSCYDAATVTGTAKIVLRAAIALSAPPLILGPNGTPFTTGLSIGTTGTTPNIAVFWVPA